MLCLSDSLPGGTESGVLSTPFRVETESWRAVVDPASGLCFKSFIFIWLELDFCIVMLDFQNLTPWANKIAHLVKMLAASCWDLHVIPGTHVVEGENRLVHRDL